MWDVIIPVVGGLVSAAVGGGVTLWVTLRKQRIDRETALEEIRRQNGNLDRDRLVKYYENALAYERSEKQYWRSKAESMLDRYSQAIGVGHDVVETLAPRRNGNPTGA